MPYTLTDLEPVHLDGALAVFNHYVAAGTAAYPLEPLSREWLEALVSSARGYPSAAVLEEGGGVVGFGLLKPWHPLLTFRKVAEVSCFIAPAHVGKGLGGRVLERLFGQAAALGISTVLANISSENARSIAFHGKHGFTRCGVFQGAGTKFGRDFDVIWMQKHLT